jgi:hypothetical protein
LTKSGTMAFERERSRVLASARQALPIWSSSPNTTSPGLRRERRRRGSQGLLCAWGRRQHSRLAQAQAQPAQLILSERVYEAVRERFPAAKPVELELKGKAEPAPAFVIDVTS